MPPNIQRFLPLLVIVAALLFILPAITKKHSGPSGKTKASATIDAMTLLSAAEKTYLAAHSRYSSHLADLVVLSPRLATALATGVTVSTLDVASDGKSFLAQVSSDQLTLVRSRTADKLLVDVCTALKSGAKCP